MKTMTAKYAGKCAACGQPISQGDTIFYFGRGHVTHANCEPGSSAEESDTHDYEAEREDGDGFPPSRAQIASDRRLAKQGLTVIRTSGGTFTQNSRGRCEDAPCCGCCS